MDRYKICICGKNPDYFLKKIVTRKINIYSLEKSRKKLTIEVDKDGYESIRKIKTSYDIYLVGVSGVLKVKEVFKKYFFFILFFCFGIFLNVFLSNIIFDVEVIHSNKNIRDILYDRLEKFGISKYRFKVNFLEKERIIKEILKREKENIEWLEIEEVGCRYVVRVEQRKLNNDKGNCFNRNIVAKKNAVIMEIHAESGEVVKKKNDYVLKGDTIISGVIHNKEDIVSTKCAVGKIFGEVWYKVGVSLPINYYEEELTGKSKIRFSFLFFNREKVLFGAYNTYRKKDILEFNNRLLPINFGIYKYFETNVNKVIYTLDNSSAKAVSLALKKLEENLGEEDVILTKKVLKKEVKNSKIVVEVFFKVKEDITSYQDIVINEAEEDGG